MESKTATRPADADQPSQVSRADLPRVEILIVTLCQAERSETLKRAIETTLEQDGVAASLIIAVNGERYDPALLEELRQMPGVRVLYQEEASIFLARRLARENVTAPYFGFLDDDDYLLPGALRSRIQRLASDAAADVVVSNGFLREPGGESLLLSDVADLQADLLAQLIRRNWLATASALFRSSSVSPDFFDVTIRSNDMTFLAFRLALERKVVFLDHPTYRKTYSADSISLTDNWNLQSLATLEKMLEFEVPPPIRTALRRKCTATAHDIAEIHRRRGNIRSAWRYHLRSISSYWGLMRYFLYGRKLIVPLLRRGTGAGKSA